MFRVEIFRMGRIKNRKQFLASVGMAGAALALARADASAEPVTASATAATAGPSPQPSEKPPSAEALAFAAGMRRFDPKLSDAEVLEIAKGIEENGQARSALNPKKKRLRNSDQPVTVFTVTPR